MPDNINVCLVGPFPEPINGCSHANETLLRGLLKTGAKCSIVNTSTPTISSVQGTHFSIAKAIHFIKTYIYVWKILQVNVVYITPGQTFFGLIKYLPFYLMCIALRKPYVLHLHGNHLGNQYNKLRNIKKAIFKYCVSHAAAGIVLSDSLRANFSQLLCPEKVFVVPNFVAEEIYDQPPANKPTDHPRLLYLSNLMREKGILFFLDALLILKASGLTFTAAIAGSMEANLRNEVEARLINLDDNVEYVGPVTGRIKIELLNSMNIFILPTYYSMEGQPIALLEALATGNIVITTKHAGIPDIITSFNGYFVPPQDASAIASIVAHIANNLRDQIHLLSDRNRKYAASHFTESLFVQRIISVLISSINNRSKI
jgi:glycosyltransferase involved in cell wall biosynthesis